MTWVLFTRRFTWTPSEERRVSIAYPEGFAFCVRSDCRKAALAAGAGKPFRAPATDDPRVQADANGVRFIAPADLDRIVP